MTDNQILKPNTPNLNDAVKTDIAKYSRNKVTGDKIAHNMVATMQTAGFISTDCISPKSVGSTATEETFKFLKNAIFSGFPKGVIELCEMTAKAAGDKQVDGRNRTYWNRQPNSLVAGIGKALRKKEEIDADIKAGKQGADATTRSAESLCVEDGEAIINRIKKAESFIVVGKDLPDWIAEFEALIRMIQK